MIRQKPHKKLTLWSKSIDLVLSIYELTKKFPREEEFGLKSQLRRASVSVPSNISEGLTRKTKIEKARFLNIAQGSLSEIDAQIEIACRLHYIDEPASIVMNEKLAEVERLLCGLMKSVISEERKERDM
jgi:four helix bundle protein